MLLCSSFLMAQTPANDVEMADLMRSNGKIYVVVAVLSIVMIGILIYLIYTEKKITRLEKAMEDKEL